MTDRRRWILWPVAVFAAVLLGVVLLFDWNWLKGPLEGWISAALERDFEIRGELDVTLGLEPRITVTGARLANPDWARAAPMLEVARASAVVDLPALLGGEVRLPEVRIAEPTLRLETRPDGPPNWVLGKDEATEGPPALPHVGSLRITDARIAYHEQGSGRTIAADLAKITGTTGGADGEMALAATGAVQGTPLDLRLGGPPAARLAAAEPYPVALRLRLGESDLAGDVALDLGGPVPAISATLRSDRIRTTDLAVMTGAAGATERPLEAALDEAVAGTARTLEEAKAGARGSADAASQARTDAWLEFADLPALRVSLDYTIDRLEGPELLLTDLTIEAGLADRLPTLALRGDGSFRGEPVVLDVQAAPLDDDDQGQTPYRIDATIEAGATRLVAAGRIADAQHLTGVDLRFEARSPDPTDVLRQLGVEAPRLPQIRAAGRVARDDQLWTISDAYAEVGESNVSGRVTVDLSRARPLIRADLSSERLRLRDLVATSEDQERAARERQPASGQSSAGATGPRAPLLTAAGVNFEALPKIDANVSFRGDYVEVPQARFERLEVDLKLRDRVAVIDATGEGRFREGGALRFEVHAGTEESLGNPDARYPLDVAIETGETRASAKGTVDRPLNYTGLDVDVALEGPNLETLGDALGLPLPGTPPYQLTGKLTHQADKERWNLIALRGSVGDSDLAGDVSFELGAAQPTLVADLKSKKLDFDDLGALVGVPATAPGETASPEQRRKAAEAAASGRFLPDEPFDVPELRAIDARVRFAGESIQASKVPLERMLLELTLADGKMTLDPLRFALADGELEAVIGLVSEPGALVGTFDISAKRIKLNRLLADFDVDLAGIEMEREGVGTFGGRAKLEARGNSMRELAGSADGDLALIMNGGQINALIIEGLGLDIGEALGLLLADDDERQSAMVPIECFVGRFDVQDGVMRTEALVLETSDSTITGRGRIDLGAEALALELLAHPKDASVLTASTPVRIEGTFKEPEVDLVSEELMEKGLGALALGVLLPVIGAVLPFIEGGETEDTNCRRLIEAAEAAVPAGSGGRSE